MPRYPTPLLSILCARARLPRYCQLIKRIAQITQAFAGWLDAMAAGKWLRFALGKAVRFMVLGAGRAFGRWAQMVEEAKRQRVVLERAVGRLMHRLMAAAFDRLRLHLCARRRLRLLLSKLANAQLFQAFGGWVARTVTARGGRGRADKAVRLLANLGIGWSFTRWFQVVRKHPPPACGCRCGP